MDDLITLSADWCDAAVRFLDPQFDPPPLELVSAPAADSRTLELDPETRLALARLTAIAAGNKIRRQLDALVPEDEIERARQCLVRRVTELQLLASEDLSSLEPDTLLHAELSARVKKSLIDTHLAFQNDTTVILDPLHLALALEGLRTDLEWLSVLVARIDHEPFHPMTTWLDLELERIQSLLGNNANPLDELETAIRSRLERTQTLILGRRVRRELDSLPAHSDAPSFWSHRLLLSRLQAQVESLAPEFDSAADGPAGADPATTWAETLRHRRDQLADRADQLLRPVPSEELVSVCARIVQCTVEEASETLAFLEQAPPRRSIERLELAQEDLDRAATSLRNQARLVRQSPATVEASPEQTPADSTQPAPAAKPTASDLEAELLGPELDGNAQPDASPAQPTPPSGDHPQLENQTGTLARTLEKQARDLQKTAAQLRGEWQEKLIEFRLARLIGHKSARLLENLILTLILVLIALIVAEAVVAQHRDLTLAQHEFFGFADLLICSVFLFEFFLKLTIAPDRLLYFSRHWPVDLVASLPFGFLYHLIDITQLDDQIPNLPEDGLLGWMVTVGRAVQFLRFARIALPFIRLTRVALILLRLSDRLVRRLASLLNRNIILFEISETLKPESSIRHRLLSLRTEIDHARIEVENRLDRAERQRLVVRLLDDLDGRLGPLPITSVADTAPIADDREIPVEAVVERLVHMTPDQLLDRMGPAFVTSVDRYFRLFDLPLIRRLPVIRSLVSHREKSPAESVALAANYLGHLIQRGLDVVYFLADLQGTLSPPVFLDRLGTTIVNAARTPAKRLLSLGSGFLILFILVNYITIFRPFRLVVDKLQTLLGWPVIILGVFCLGFWLLGSWFKKIANQSADFSERIVEAQFAARTKLLKTHRRDHDYKILSERVIDPELRLRSSDDHVAPTPASHPHNPRDPISNVFENREHVFLRNIRLLYQDYLDGSPLHRSDTKASVQLMGNLALTNLRRSHLGPLIRESRALDRLDLNRAGSLFGGPYLWFNYITRMLVQETAILILDFNRNAVPLDRLACGPHALRARFQTWLAYRLRIDPDQVRLPDALSPLTNQDQPTSPAGAPRRRLADTFLETVEFTAVDFLADDPDRDAEILSRFGPQVAELVRRDRQQNVRRAFRSFPLHELPASLRTINPFYLYENYLAGGRIAFLPVNVARGLAQLIKISLAAIYRVVRDILNPQVDRQTDIPSDTYWAALRKIHRMRKPVFMGSLWLRASFDVEYLGLPLPTAPPQIAAPPTMDRDLDYIGATRQDRLIAERVRRLHQKRLESILRWLVRLGWTFNGLPAYLSREIPYLANRGGEAVRALVTACVLDHDDIATLALSIDALSQIFAHAADSKTDPQTLPNSLPGSVTNLRSLWHPRKRHIRPSQRLFALPCFPEYDPAARLRILAYLDRHRGLVRGWITVVLDQGAGDPWSVIRGRMREVLLRTDLWSDQILVLRAVQTLTMLDLQHNSELVWKLGGYTRPDADSEDSRELIPTPTPTAGKHSPVQSTTL